MLRSDNMSERKQLVTRVNDETHQWLKQEAEKQGLSMSQVVNRAIMEYIEAKEAFDSIGGIDAIAKLLKQKTEDQEGEK